MDIFEAIEKRYSHKTSFLGEPVPRAHLEKIARCGLLAPSGRNAQCVHLVIVDDAQVLAKLCEVASSGGLRSAPAAIVVLTDSDTQDDGMNFEKEDYSAAIENMLLAAVALGYASVWLDGILMNPSAQEGYRKVLGVPQSFHVPVILPIGKPNGEGTRREKRPLIDRLSYNQF